MVLRGRDVDRVVADCLRRTIRRVCWRMCTASALERLPALLEGPLLVACFGIAVGCKSFGALVVALGVLLVPLV